MLRGTISLLLCSLCGILLSQNGIRRVQYYWNNGSWSNSTEVMLSGADTIDQELNLNLAEAGEGMNFLHLRVIDTDGVPSIPTHYTFRKVFNLPLSPVTNLEYFWDVDPGEGNGTSINFASGTELDVSSSVNMPEDWSRIHFLGLRAKNDLGKWSFPLWKQVFNVQSPDLSEVAGLGWYFTGAGSPPDEYSQEFQGDPGQSVEEVVAIPLDELIEGQSYLLHVYALSSEGTRSQELLVPFTADFQPQHPVLSYSQGTITLSWDPVPGADHYQVYQSSTPDGFFSKSPARSRKATANQPLRSVSIW